MDTLKNHQIESAEIVVPCENLAENLAFLAETLEFRLLTVYPADAPRVAVLSGYGCRIRLEEQAGAAPVSLHLLCKETDIASLSAKKIVPPNGIRLEFEATDASPYVLDLLPSLTVRKADQSNWGVGRAGMQYRDLIPDRWGDAYIASHIRIPQGGPVADYVHFHDIIFQLIYCYKGWVRVVYEDQGPAFVMHAGDCVLQPPHIRHQVLECSDEFEVIEVGCPAEHATQVDHEMTLPTQQHKAHRKFSGQDFCFHQSASAHWSAWSSTGFERRDTGIARATSNRASVSVVRPEPGTHSAQCSHSAELLFLFILQGSMTLECPNNEFSPLLAGDACTIPPGTDYQLSICSPDLEFLEVTSSG